MQGDQKKTLTFSNRKYLFYIILFKNKFTLLFIPKNFRLRNIHFSVEKLILISTAFKLGYTSRNFEYIRPKVERKTVVFHTNLETDKQAIYR